MNADGRLLVLLGLAGVAGAVSVRGSRGVVRRSASVLRSKDPVVRAEILESAARALFVDAWASDYEESGRSTRHWAGQDLMKLAPPTNERAREMVKEWAGKIETRHGAPIDVLYERAAAATELEMEQDGKRHKAPTPEDFGHYLALEGIGHGVSWMDDHADHGLGDLPHLEKSNVEPDLGSDNRGSRGVVRRTRPPDTRLAPILERTLATQEPLVAASVIAFFAEKVAHLQTSDPILPLGPSSRIPKIPMYAGPLGLLQLRDDAAQLVPSAALGPRPLASTEAAIQALLPFIKSGKWWNGAVLPLEEPVPGFAAWLTVQIVAIVKNKKPEKVLDPRRPRSTAKVLLDAATLADIRLRFPTWFSIELGEGRASHLATPEEVAAHVRLAVLWNAWSKVTSFARKNPDDWRTMNVKQILSESRKRE